MSAGMSITFQIHQQSQKRLTRFQMHSPASPYLASHQHNHYRQHANHNSKQTASAIDSVHFCHFRLLTQQAPNDNDDSSMMLRSLLQDEDMTMSLKQVLQSPRGIATVVFEVVSYAAMLPFIYVEVRTVQEYWDDWLNAWNAIDVLAYSFQVNRLTSHNLLWSTQ